MEARTNLFHSSPRCMSMVCSSARISIPEDAARILAVSIHLLPLRIMQ